jgi:hypothetical protein
VVVWLTVERPFIEDLLDVAHQSLNQLLAAPLEPRLHVMRSVADGRLRGERVA